MRIGIPTPSSLFRLLKAPLTQFTHCRLKNLSFLTAALGVGAAPKVSPNWSQGTMTCHSSNCFNIVWGQGNAPLAAVSVSTTFYRGAKWASQGEKWARGGSSPRSNPLTFYIPFFTYQRYYFKDIKVLMIISKL